MAKISRTKKAYQDISDASSETLTQRLRTLKSIKTKADDKRSFLDIIADRATKFFGSNLFLYINVIWFISWLVINTNGIPGIEPFDPFPFSFLTSTVSLEAIILAIFVLISQNRAAKVADLREETQLQINILAEEENTKILRMLVLLLQKNKIPIPKDKQLKEMLRKTDTQKLERNIEKQIDKS